MKYRLDLHVHTDRSIDSRATLPQLAKAAQQKGIHAFAVSDHNVAAFDLPHMEDVLLIPAVEYSTEIGHLLGLFLQAPCHVEGEETGRVRFSDAAHSIRQARGLCILAHPYERTSVPVSRIDHAIEEYADLLDGIEIYNCRATKKRKNANEMAIHAAKKLGKLQTAGSDAHFPAELGGAWVEVEADALSLPALRQALQNPTAFSCGRCRHMAFARSQWIQRRKSHAPFRSYLSWFAFAGVCFLRWLKGVFA